MNSEVTEEAWPDISLLRIQVDRSAQWFKRINARPFFSREPDLDWCSFFAECCENDSEIAWKGAGFVDCVSEELEHVELRLLRAVENANQRFRADLRIGLHNNFDPENVKRVIEIIKLEKSLAATGDTEGSPCRFL